MGGILKDIKHSDLEEEKNKDLATVREQSA
jgi:hypothetical protein